MLTYTSQRERRPAVVSRRDGLLWIAAGSAQWSPRGLPHEVEPNHHCRRSVIGALDFGVNTLIHTAHAGTIKDPDVVDFIDGLLAAGDGRPTVIVLDNAGIHDGIDAATRDRWLMDRRALLFYLPVYSPELNKIEIVWRQLKY
ncbi:transposase [Burkholderia ubonensis]|uniref:transposase n=1 Tax=Burkholderia ubonensis TaxID=101571 RepID=UPI0012F7F02A|nr:transposase [Burkholderia ubonensis]